LLSPLSLGSLQSLRRMSDSSGIPLQMMIARVGLAACCGLLVPLVAVVVGSADAVARLRSRRSATPWPPPYLSHPLPDHRASIVIGNWNCRHLLERGLPSLIASLDGPDHELLLVDN